MVEIKCGDCGAAIMDRSKSIYSNEMDHFYCNDKCESNHKQQSSIELQSSGMNRQLRWNWMM